MNRRDIILAPLRILVGLVLVKLGIRQKKWQFTPWMPVRGRKVVWVSPPCPKRFEYGYMRTEPMATLRPHQRVLCYPASLREDLEALRDDQGRPVLQLSDRLYGHQVIWTGKIGETDEET